MAYNDTNMKDLSNTLSNIQHEQDELNKKLKALKKCKQTEKEKLKKGYIWKRLDNKTLILTNEKT